MAAADQAAQSGNVADQAAAASLLAGAKADAAAAAATQAAAQAAAADTQSSLAAATANAATAAAAQAIAKANDAAAQSALAQAQSQAAAGLAADAKIQSQAAADQAALALARANSDSAQLNTATANAAAAAAAAAQALATANDVAAKLAPTPTPIPSPVVQVTTYVGDGKGLANGQLAAALFDHPNGLALDPAGNLLVADAGNNQIRRITSDGVVSTVAGSGRGYVDGQGANAAFNNPYGVAAGPDGVIYVADTNNHCVRKIALDGTVTTLAGNGIKGFVDGTGTAARFSSPFSLDVDATGNVYVADAGNNRIRRIAPNGVVVTIAGSGKAGKLDGSSVDAQFNLPSDVAVDGTGTIFVADLGNNAVRKIASDGRVSTVAGNGAAGAADGAGPIAQFNAPSGLALGLDGCIVIADTQNNRLRKITPTGQVTTIAGLGAKGASDGASSSANFYEPSDVLAMPDGTIYVADTENNRLRRVR
jgi:sugar lactone lactonase YvrE